jgi:hypothetical protein
LDLLAGEVRDCGCGCLPAHDTKPADNVTEESLGIRRRELADPVVLSTCGRGPGVISLTGNQQATTELTLRPSRLAMPQRSRIQP